MATDADVLSLARSEVGVSEHPPGSNRGTPYHAWFGAHSQGWPWCAIFVSWVYWHTDPALIHRVRSAYSGDYLAAGRKHGEMIDLPLPGAICIMDYGDGGITDHIGIVDTVNGRYFRSVEGNHQNRVEYVWRFLGDGNRYWFVMPRYEEAEPERQREEESMYDQRPAAARHEFLDCYRDRYDYFVLTRGVVANLRFRIRGHDGGEGDTEPQPLDGLKVHNLQDILNQPRMQGVTGSFLLIVDGEGDEFECLLREVPK